MEDLYIIRPDYTPTSKLYDFKKPEIPTGDTYYFTTDSGLEYQVRFGKKRENYLGNIVKILNYSSPICCLRRLVLAAAR